MLSVCLKSICIFSIPILFGLSPCFRIKEYVDNVLGYKEIGYINIVVCLLSENKLSFGVSTA